MSDHPLTWMAAAFRKNGLRVKQVKGWKTAGRPYSFAPKGVMFHHTASNSRSGAAPALGICVKGRMLPDGRFLPGPLCNVLIGRDGTVYLLAAGRANHAGYGGPWREIPKDSGNAYTIGVEVENDGTGEAWSGDLLETCEIVFATLLIGLKHTEAWLCFPAGVIILTKNGLVPIETVSVGDQVWTHRNRWRPVTEVGQRHAETVRLRGHGHPGLLVTPEHPFWSPSVSRGHVLGRPGGNYRKWGPFGWVQAERMAGRHWASPIIPTEPGNEPVSPERAWVLGNWLAEGWISEGALYHSVGLTEADEVLERISAAGWNARPKPARGSCVVIRIATGAAFTSWVRDEFGQGAGRKHLPTWAFFAPKAGQAILDGYWFGDGHEPYTGFIEAGTVSKALAIGIKLLAQARGYATAMYRRRTEPSQYSIDGRTGPQREQWIVKARSYASSRSQGVILGDWWVTRVRSVEASVERDVYNLSVAEDESYVADGLVVHNCGHKEWASARGKIDPGGIDMDGYRRRVRRRIRAVASGSTKKPSPAEPSERPKGGDVYVVQAGDTLWSIATRYGMSVDQLMSLNELTDTLIHPGDRLKVAGATGPP
jgi:LysM repeat protein